MRLLMSIRCTRNVFLEPNRLKIEIIQGKDVKDEENVEKSSQEDGDDDDSGTTNFVKSAQARCCICITDSQLNTPSHTDIQYDYSY